nr:uncharacterized protein LOC102149515 isoform X3 [Equus caballus]XP_023490693.1 uncharacterized protein LOC102149515 isoform X3 [Equus caballus]XP_023490694.1 uncharacterized protein LOC102149515 isoform X3 [Equus caballus]XP_023490695.1 uncharacterized protein LOC102149515 isoform X3 [Equus caballus]XP_023490696.1 uncharacterized protein LOC102149515 isoform X3 [Equus caballus]XP_023490697.1 uncharacterized protein LOC102149515 isoform X3 [Equus caballus]XP_023490698.1 uncharacterized prot
MAKMNSTQEIFEELCDGFDFSPSLVKRQEQQATSSILCRSEEPTLSVAEARTMLTLKAGAVQKVVGCLQPSFHGRSISVTTFPCVYQAFYPTPQVLDQLLQSAGTGSSALSCSRPRASASAPQPKCQVLNWTQRDQGAAGISTSGSSNTQNQLRFQRLPTPVE